MRLTRASAVALCLFVGGCAKAPPLETEIEADQEIEAAELPAVPSMRLTASDGTGLELVALDVRGVIQGPLGFTQLHLTFDNPNDRTLAGQFEIQLPPGAALSRFAMKDAQGWQEGEVVERGRARAIYDQYLHRRVDPALLQKQAGNRFSAKVFPIPANGRKELVLSYSQALDGTTPYRVPLRGLPQLERLDTRVLVDHPIGDTMQRQVLESHETNHRPRADLEVAAPSKTSPVALRSDEGVVARVTIPGEAETAPLESLTIAFDTSASRSLGYGEHVRSLARLVEALAEEEPDLALRVVAFDQTTELMFEGTAASFDAAAQARLLARQALGASDLDALLSQLRRDPPTRLLLMTDGMPTIGDRMSLEFLDVPLLHHGGLQRLDAIVDGATGSDTQLAYLVQRLPDMGVVTRSDVPAQQQAERLRRRVLPAIDLTVEGATRTWPSTVRGKQPGDTVMVYAHEAPKGPLEVHMHGAVTKSVSVPTVRVTGPLLSRALAGARIEAMTAEYGSMAHTSKEQLAARSRLRTDIVALSRRSRVLSDFTAMLVLEGDDDYARSGIDRTANVDILVVEDQGVVAASTKRSFPAWTSPPAAEPPAPTEKGILSLIDSEAGHFLASPYGGAFAEGRDEAKWGALAYGGATYLDDPSGSEASGSGQRHKGEEGRMGRPSWVEHPSQPTWSSPPLPRTTLTEFYLHTRKLKVTGKLDRDIVRRILRAHVNEARLCYTRAAQRDTDPRGPLDLTFEVSGKGKVRSIEPGPKVLDDETTSCMQNAIRRWRFPRSRNGKAVTVNVQYQMVKRRGGGVRSTLQPLPLGIAAAVASTTTHDLDDVDAALYDPYRGPMAEVAKALEQGETETAMRLASQWHREAPLDIMALIGLGLAYEAAGQRELAARCYGSLIDLYPADAPMLRHASARLSSLGSRAANRVALRAAKRALQERPDHPSSHRLYAWALASHQRWPEALDRLYDASGEVFSERYRGVQAIFQDDMRAVAAKWLANMPEQASEVRAHAKRVGVDIPTEPVTHFVLSWETDANDVDLHVYDGEGHHAYYRDKALASGGRLYADVTEGYGPESFTIHGEPTGYPYRIDVDYFAQGAMGYGLGTLQVIRTDEPGPPSTHPFALMVEKGRTRVLQLER